MQMSMQNHPIKQESRRWPNQEGGRIKNQTLYSGVAEPCFGRLAGPKIQLALFEMVKESISQNVT